MIICVGSFISSGLSCFDIFCLHCSWPFDDFTRNIQQNFIEGFIVSYIIKNEKSVLLKGFEFHQMAFLCAYFMKMN